MKSPFLWRHIAIVLFLAATFALSIAGVYKARAVFREYALPIGIALRASSFVFLLLSVFALLVACDLFYEMEFAFDWRPNREWHRIIPGTTRRQVVDLLGPTNTHIRYEYYYQLFPMYFNQGTITFEGDASTLVNQLEDKVDDNAKVVDKSPERTSSAWLPGGFPHWLNQHIEATILPLTALTLLVLSLLSLVPFHLRNGWNSWTLYIPVMAVLAAALYERSMHSGWRFDQFFLVPMYLVILGTWAARLWHVVKAGSA